MAKGKSIQGTDGDDELVGTGKNDKIDGKEGDDEIAGGKGKDKLTGGPGGDIFIFNAKSDLEKGNVDTIKDFVPGEDQIGLSYKVFKGMGFGTLKETHFVVGSRAKDDDDHIIFNPETRGLYYDKDGEGGAKAKQFAKLDGVGDPDYFDMVLSLWKLVDSLKIATPLSHARAEAGFAVAKVNVINGTDEDDELLGTKKDDRIVGGEGDDEISGGEAGKDVLIGGAGADNFFFQFKGDLKAKNMDTIKDLDPNEDTLILSYKVFKNMGFGPIQDSFVHVGKKAADEDDYLLVNRKNGVVSYDADANGKGDAVEFLKFKGIPWDHISGAIQNGFMSYNPEWEN
jgi:Ca2+-binding RTX toxin-like protein